MTDNPLQWLEAYLSRRAGLASHKSDFHCAPACTRPGCKNPDLQVPVSLIDLVAAARRRHEPVAALYHRHYSLGLLADERQDWLRIVTLRLKKPCAYLQNDLCGIYPVRPLPCILFPEYLVNEGRFQEEAQQAHFHDYLCFHQPLPLSPERARVMTQLKQMWIRESLVSSYYLFHQGQCLIDFSNLMDELLPEAVSLGEAVPADQTEQSHIIPNAVMERYFLEHMAGCQPFAGVSDAISRLQQPEGLKEFLQLLKDDRRVQKIRREGHDRARVFRLVGGELRARRQSLTHAASKLYG